MKLRAIALVALTALAPMGALAQERLNEEQLIALLNERKACGEQPVNAGSRLQRYCFSAFLKREVQP